MLLDSLDGADAVVFRPDFSLAERGLETSLSSEFLLDSSDAGQGQKRTQCQQIVRYVDYG